MGFRKLIVTILFLMASLSFAESDIGKSINDKLDIAFSAMEKNKMDQAWEMMTQVSAIIDKHPNYDDGEYAETISSTVVAMLGKPWKYASPYLVGDKSSESFRKFILGHVNELATPQDLLPIKKNVSAHCNAHQYKFCDELIKKVDSASK